MQLSCEAGRPKKKETQDPIQSKSMDMTLCWWAAMKGDQLISCTAEAPMLILIQTASHTTGGLQQKPSLRKVG